MAKLSVPARKLKKPTVRRKPSKLESGEKVPQPLFAAIDEDLRAFLVSEAYVFDGDWPTLQMTIIQRVESLHGRGHAEMFARNLGARETRHDNMRSGIVEVLAKFMESEQEANLLMSVHGEEVLAGYTEVLRVLKESGGVGGVVEFGAWTGSFGRFLLGKKLAKAYFGIEALDRVVGLVADRRSPKAFHLQNPHGHDVEDGHADWLVCTLGLHRRAAYFFDEDDELSPLPIEYQDDRVVAQAKEYYAGLFAPVASVVHSNTKMVLTQPIRSFAEVWGLTCAARDAGWSLVQEMCRCVWGGKRFATLVLQRGKVTMPMTLSDAACWWGTLVAPFSTSMTALSDVALGEYFALKDRVSVHSGQVGRSAVEVGFYKQGAYAIHSAAPGGFTMFIGASEGEVQGELREFCEAHGDELPEDAWPNLGVVSSASGLIIAATEERKTTPPPSNKDERRMTRDNLKRSVEAARALDLTRLREMGAVFPACLDDSVLRTIDAAALREVEEGELRLCVMQTLNALAPELYKQYLIDEIVAARLIEVQAMDLTELRSLHAAEFGEPPARKKQPDRKICVREVTNHEEAKLKKSTVRKIESLHRRKSERLSRSDLAQRFIDDLWYIDAKHFVHAQAKRFEAALASPSSRAIDIKTSLLRWLKEEEAKLAEAKATTSDPELLSEQQAVVDDLGELLIHAKDNKKWNDAGRIRLSEQERAEFEERWRCDGGIEGFSEAVKVQLGLNEVENLHRCYDSLHRLVEGARTNVEDWERKSPKLAAIRISKSILGLRNLIRVSGIGPDGRAMGSERGARLKAKITLPKSTGHTTAFHPIQAGLLSECGVALDVNTIRRLLAEISNPLDWLPEFLLWRTWRRAVEQGRSSVYKLRVDFDRQADGLGVPDDATHAVRQFLLRCEYGFLHMLNRYPDRASVSAQVTRALAHLPPRQKKV